MLHVDTFGTGAAVVLLHGTPTPPAHMTRLAARLADRGQIHVVHLPGYGASPSLEPYDLARTHELVEEALLARGVTSAHWVGFSGGSYRAFALALRGRIVPRSVTGLGSLAEPLPDRQALVDLLRGDAPLPDLVPLMLSARGQKDAAAVADVATWATCVTRHDLANDLGGFVTAPDLRAELATLAVPILLRVGDADLATPPALTARIQAAAPRAVVEIVPGVGHAILWEDLDATAASVARHVASAG